MCKVSQNRKPPVLCRHATGSRRHILVAYKVQWLPNSFLDTLLDTAISAAAIISCCPEVEKNLQNATLVLFFGNLTAFLWHNCCDTNRVVLHGTRFAIKSAAVTQVTF